ncbi:MAG: hypothetical protein ACREDY_01300 [Bradyrhizobium sp.]
MAKPSLTQATLDTYRHDLHARHGQALAALLQPGESLEELSVARLSASVKAPPMRLLPKGSRIEDWGERAARVQTAIDYAPGNAFFGVVGRLTSTRPSMTGGWDGEAGRFVILVFAASRQKWTMERQFCLARTNRRLVLLTAPWTSGTRPFRLLTEYPSGSLVLNPDWKLRPGGNRVDVGFADGSTLEFRAEFPAGALLAQVLGSPVKLP